MKTFFMRLLLYALPAIAAERTAAQEWHPANKWLKEPESPSGFYTSASYFTRYDTVPCVYESLASDQVQKGYKVVFVKDGYYTDNSRTFGLFLNDRFQRIYHIRRYSFSK
ncbi:MAG TPA: hypothetical protein VKR41_08845 [Puia sp.]|nr:hypothetical protein [Puia sp.]